MIEGIEMTYDSLSSAYPEVGTLLALIPFGAKNAISLNALSNSLKLEKRDLLKLIVNSRITGAIICETEAGYYLPNTMTELSEYYVREESRIRNAIRALSVVDAWLREPPFVSEFDKEKEWYCNE